MKRGIFISIIILFTACSKPVHPEFRRVDDLVHKEIDNNKIELTGQAVFYNPNGFRVKLSKMDLLAHANEVEVAHIKQELSTTMPSKSEFTLPLTVELSPEDLFLKKDNILQGILDALTTKKVNLRYTGTVTVDLVGINIDIPVDYKEEIEIK